MYSVMVELGFSALHRVALRDGTLEPLHGHDWIVRAWFERAALDDRGMVLDFHEARETLRSILADLHHGNLNDLPVLHDSPPTAEAVARYIFERLSAHGLGSVRRVEVTEAPGCVAAYTRE